MALEWKANPVWRESGRQVKIGPLDARLLIFFVLFFLHISWLTFFVIIAGMLFFYGLEYFGYSLPNSFRKIRILISGNLKYGVHYWRQNKFKY